MDGAWQIVKWIWVTVCFTWLVVQALALRPLKGDLKRRSMNVFWVVFILMMISDWIRDVSENPEATRIGMRTVGVAAIGATVVLARLLASKVRIVVDDRDRDVEEDIQSLKLS